LEAEAEDDADSALGDDNSVTSSTTSLGSSIMKHREENGRTYHVYKEGKYLYPNDEGENDRLDLQHHIYSLAYGGRLHLCDFDKDKPIHRVLDVGTGTGIWAIDYGDEHPEAMVVGVDLSPIQPQFLPPNVIFEIDDVEEPWTYSQKFDFIHGRMMTGSLVSWPKYWTQAYDNLTPGGYIEHSDVVFPFACDDGTMPNDCALNEWSKLMLDGSEKIGRSVGSGVFYKEQMEAAGFVDVHEVIDLWPLNKWPKNAKYKELGMWNNENLTGGLQGLSLAIFTRVHGWSPQKVEAFLVDVRKDMNNTKIHSYSPIRTIYGRKPS